MIIPIRPWAAIACVVTALAATAPIAAAQTGMPRPDPPEANGNPGLNPPADYVIGPEDQLSVLFWVDRSMSAEVVVRPDGKISLPLINEIQAAGLTPEQLRHNISAEAKRFVQDPNATVLVRQINSRKVFITGAVERPGPYPLISPSTVLQLIATAGGLKEYAESKKILVIRNDAGKTVTFKFNYREVIEQKNLKQNIDLRPGDMVLVP